jgi:hypothetical protein
MEMIMEVIYRQTLNLITKRWVIPKRKIGPTTWVAVKNIKSVISPKFGYAGAIRRIQKVFDKKRNPDGSRAWTTKVHTEYLPRDSKGRSQYAVTYLKCNRTSYGFTRSL